MAYEFLDDFLDGRVKILKCQRERLTWMHEHGKFSYADLAKKYNISKTMAYYICNPGKYHINIKNRIKRSKDIKIDKALNVSRATNSRNKRRVYKSVQGDSGSTIQQTPAEVKENSNPS